jgi:alpha-1,6-mannosyltransferase
VKISSIRSPSTTGNITISLWCIVLLILFYFPQRTDHFLLITSFLFAAALQWKIWSIWKDQDLPSWIILGIAILGFAVLWSPVHLSEDIYRFYWDGRLLLEGIHPYAYTPSDILELNISPQNSDFFAQLYPKLNSPEYYSVYPPISQYIFAGLAWLAGNSFFYFTVLFRVVIILSLVLLVHFVSLLLRSHQIPTGQSIMLTFHPLLWLEGIGNFHFELVQLAILAGALMALRSKYFFLSGILWGFAIWIKLLPLMLVIFVWRFLSWNNFSYFILGLISASFVSIWPLWNTDVWLNMAKSIDLYFRTFEFNASIYYFARWLGFQFKGYNLIHILGPMLAVFTASIGMILAWRQRKGQWLDFYASCSWIFLVYFLFATTVHPWYLITPLLFALFVRHYFIWVFSIVVIFSYTAYGYETASERKGIIILEYMILFITLIVYFRDRKNKPLNQQI